MLNPEVDHLVGMALGARLTNGQKSQTTKCWRRQNKNNHNSNKNNNKNKKKKKKKNNNNNNKNMNMNENKNTDNNKNKNKNNNNNNNNSNNNNNNYYYNNNNNNQNQLGFVPGFAHLTPYRHTWELLDLSGNLHKRGPWKMDGMYIYSLYITLIYIYT